MTQWNTADSEARSTAAPTTHKPLRNLAKLHRTRASVDRGLVRESQPPDPRSLPGPRTHR